MKYRHELRPIAKILAQQPVAEPRDAVVLRAVIYGTRDRRQALPRTSLLPLRTMLACMAYAPAIALAQTTPAADPTLPEVKVRDASPGPDYNPAVSTIGGGVATPLRDIPQSVTVINSALMQAQGATSLSDALRNVPGITMGAAEGGSIGNNFNLRGFSARTDLYLDGMRDRGQFYRDVFSLDSVEVLQGPSSMLFGRGSTGGVINQVSKLPSLAPFATGTVVVGTQPSARVTADYNQPIDETSAFRLAAMGQDVHSTRDVMVNHDYGLAPSLRFGIGTPTEITLNALLSVQQRHARLRSAAGQWRAGRRQPQEFLRCDRRSNDPGRRQPQRDDQPQVHVQRHAAQPDVLLALPDQRARVGAEQRRHAFGATAPIRAFPADESEQRHRRCHSTRSSSASAATTA